MTISERVWESFAKGDIEPLYRYMYPDMVTYAAAILKDNLAFLTEDCVQTAVAETYTRRDQFSCSSQWHSYLLHCIRNNAISYLRKFNSQVNYHELSPISEFDDEDIELDIIRQETLSNLFYVIGELPPEMKELLQLSFVEGLKNAEIADRLGIALITVKKRKARLIEILRDHIDNLYCLILLQHLLAQHTN